MGFLSELRSGLRRAASEFSPAMRTYTLDVPGMAGPLVVDPDTGNMVASPAGPPTTVTFRLNPVTKPELVELAGADAEEIPLLGHWGTLDDPQGKPAAIQYGSSYPLTLQSRSGTITFTKPYPTQSTLHPEVYGERFFAVWRHH